MNILKVMKLSRAAILSLTAGDVIDNSLNVNSNWLTDHSQNSYTDPTLSVL